LSKLFKQDGTKDKNNLKMQLNTKENDQIMIEKIYLQTVFFENFHIEQFIYLFIFIYFIFFVKSIFNN
jgi:hypothetical protein